MPEEKVPVFVGSSGHPDLDWYAGLSRKDREKLENKIRKKLEGVSDVTDLMWYHTGLVVINEEYQKCKT